MVDIFFRSTVGGFGFVPKAGGFDQRCGTRSAGSESSPCLQFDLPRGGPWLMGLDGMSSETSSPKPAWMLTQDKSGKNVSTALGTVTCSKRGQDDDKAGFSWVWSVVELVTVIPWEVGGLVQYLISK